MCILPGIGTLML